MRILKKCVKKEIELDKSFEKNQTKSPKLR